MQAADSAQSIVIVQVASTCAVPWQQTGTVSCPCPANHARTMQGALAHGAALRAFDARYGWQYRNCSAQRCKVFARRASSVRQAAVLSGMSQCVGLFAGGYRPHGHGAAARPAGKLGRAFARLRGIGRGRGRHRAAGWKASGNRRGRPLSHAGISPGLPMPGTPLRPSRYRRWLAARRA